MDKKKNQNNFRSSKLSLGISLLVLGLIIFMGRNSVEPTILLNNSFKDEPVMLEGFSESALEPDKQPLKIVIPSVNVDLTVRKSNIINGYWQVFETKAGWGEGSGVPGEKGNQVIFAHAKEGLFLPLQSIKVGSLVYIFTKEKWFEYKVGEIKSVYPGETEVIAPMDDEILTLYTCSGFADSKRLIVVAERT